MKIKCDFCKTEYNLERAPTTSVKCAVCGHVWAVANPSRKNMWLVLFASVCALLSAIVFTVTVITHYQAKQVSMEPLVAVVKSVDTKTDESGITHLVVRGVIQNTSNSIYGVPDLIIVSKDKHGNVLTHQKFMPSATLIDSGDTISFEHVLAPQPVGVKKISAQLDKFDKAKEEE